LGAFYLIDLDHRMANLDVKYFRYMDDILILAPTRWKLKKAIRVLNETLDELKLEKHPDKTDMGRMEKGFDFLGYHFSPQGLSLAEKTVENFLEKARRINEQSSSIRGKEELSDYVERWRRWAVGGLSHLPTEKESPIHERVLGGLRDCPAHCHSLSNSPAL
jgi:RNA-directed DNA polymerase